MVTAFLSLGFGVGVGNGSGVGEVVVDSRVVGGLTVDEYGDEEDSLQGNVQLMGSVIFVALAGEMVTFEGTAGSGVV